MRRTVHAGCPACWLAEQCQADPRRPRPIAHQPTTTSPAAIATAICLLLLLGACGKSAQFPLHVWLPDAMEGPTPVSALIHAATMVTAGVYMVARCTPLFMRLARRRSSSSPCIGGFTALLAGLIALTQTDLKRVLAYSTISQLGYMFLGLGAGTLAGITAGMFHLFTHAFFKALLFLGAGSVMHAMGGVIDMRQFGGLRRLMPVHALDVPRRLPGPGRRVSVRRLLEQRRHPRLRCTTRSTRSSTNWSTGTSRTRRASIIRMPASARREPAGRLERQPARAPAATVYQWLYYGARAHGVPDRVLHVPRVFAHVLRPGAHAARRRAIMPTSRRRR